MAAGSSIFPDASAQIEDLEFLYASNVNVSNFVSVKLSHDCNYPLWKAQMICLMNVHSMGVIVDDTLARPRTSSMEIMEKYHSLLKGWIFGSVSEEVLGTIVDLESVKDIWNKLKSLYDPTMSSQQAPTNQGSETETNKTEVVSAETSMTDVVSTETNTNSEYVVTMVDKAPTNQGSETETNKTEVVSAETSMTDVVSTETNTNSEYIVTMVDKGKDISSTKTETEGEDTKKMEKKIEHKKKLREATVTGDWVKAESILKEDKDLAREAISSDGSTVLHIAVGTGHNDLLKKLFSYINDEDLLAARHSDECTALHIAAIVGNTYAAELLVNKNKCLLRMKDKKKEEPLHKAYENMHLDTIGYFLKAVNDDKSPMKDHKLRSLSFGSSVHPHLHPGVEIGVDLLVNAISAKQYKLASELVEKFPKFASKNDDVLMAIAQTFPNGLNHLETLMYPSLGFTWELISFTAEVLFLTASLIPMAIYDAFLRWRMSKIGFSFELTIYLLLTVPFMLLAVIILIILLIVVVWFLFLVLYWLLWKAARIPFAPVKHIENKKKEWDEATKVLELVCDEIDKLKISGTYHPFYTRPILEASCQNAYKVVDEILFRSPEAIQSRNKSGYDIIQLSIINRSEKIYNLIYDIGERKNLYRTVEDTSKNNILHLAGRLAPSHELNKRRGAALQLQRELQWREEVRKHVFPTYITRGNIFGETPDMVFTREHEKLVKEGESWMKTTAESCSITAALITTIVFAAAITVPGGSNQETGIPLFTKNGAFTVFAVSDAISLFASSTALLVFLSILTARFSENDFLVSLPRRMLIGLFSLLLSTVAMMVAFSATLFLVFCDREPWMLAPICVSALIPIGFFVNLQFPLIVDLFRSTYLRVFGKERKSVLRRFNPNDIRLYFVK